MCVNLPHLLARLASCNVPAGSKYLDKAGCFVMLAGLGLTSLFAAGCSGPSVAAGKTLYEENGCASCHGHDGRGDGPTARNLPAKPIDFHDVAAFKRGYSEEAIAQTIAQGISGDHYVPTLHMTLHLWLMPKFDHLSKAERRSIALYVISFRASDQQRSVQP